MYHFYHGKFLSKFLRVYIVKETDFHLLYTITITFYPIKKE